MALVHSLLDFEVRGPHVVGTDTNRIIFSEPYRLVSVQEWGRVTRVLTLPFTN